MSLRKRTLLLIVLVFGGLTVLLFMTLRISLVTRLFAVEQRNATDSVKRVVNTLAREEAELSLTCADYARWDSTYEFLQGSYPDYPEIELTSFGNLGLNLAVFVNPDGDVVYAKAYDLVNATDLPLPPSIDEFFSGESALLQHSELLSEITGIVMLPDTPMLVASVPILTSMMDGPAAGTLIFGRYLDDAAIAALSERVLLPISLTRYDGNAFPELAAAIADPATAIPVALDRSQSDVLTAYTALNDINGNPALVLGVQLERQLYQDGIRMVTTMFVVLGLSALAAGLIMHLVLQRWVLRRLASLNTSLAAITRSNDPAGRVPVEGRDELAGLATSINSMLAALDESYEQLREQAAELRIASAKAKEAARLRGEFLANMSHELRTPLNAIIGFSDMLLMGMNGELNENQRHKVERLRENGARLLTLVNDILDISRIQSRRVELTYKSFSLRTLYDRIAGQIAVLVANKGLDLVVSVDSAVPDRMIGDEKRIEQIVVNLMSNAVKFTDTGTISLRASVDLANKHWRIIVADTGIGIPPHAHEIIFEEFRQLDGSTSRAHRGTGLGLAIARHLVQAMEGQIQVDSELGEGTTFTVTLPLILAEQEPVPALVLEVEGA